VESTPCFVYILPDSMNDSGLNGLTFKRSPGRFASLLCGISGCNGWRFYFTNGGVCQHLSVVGTPEAGRAKALCIVSAIIEMIC
jgi:hypothetical protein